MAQRIRVTLTFAKEFNFDPSTYPKGTTLEGAMAFERKMATDTPLEYIDFCCSGVEDHIVTVEAVDG